MIYSSLQSVYSILKKETDVPGKMSSNAFHSAEINLWQFAQEIRVPLQLRYVITQS